MKKRIFISMIAMFLFLNCFADEQRLNTEFKSKNGEYSIRYQMNKWVLTGKRSALKYGIADHGFKSMTILISNNGRNVVVIDDFMQGHEIGNRNALWFYEKGKLVKSYKLKDLLNDTCNVSKSIWHTTWCLDDFDFSDNESHLSVSTYEMTDFVFDLKTGKIIKKQEPDNCDSESLIVCGEFYKGSGDQVNMKIKKYIKGKLQKNNQITFKTKHFGLGTHRQVVLIKNGVDVTPEKYIGKIYF